MIQLTTEEKKRFSDWVIQNVDDSITLRIDGDGNEIVYNLVKLINGDPSRYNNQKFQNEELELWKRSNDV